jgi:hypothetical protein
MDDGKELPARKDCQQTTAQQVNRNSQNAAAFGSPFFFCTSPSAQRLPLWRSQPPQAAADRLDATSTLVYARLYAFEHPVPRQLLSTDQKADPDPHADVVRAEVQRTHVATVCFKTVRPHRWGGFEATRHNVKFTAPLTGTSRRWLVLFSTA